MAFDEKIEVTTTELAAVLGITARRVQQISQDGIIKPHTRGKYILADSIQRYIELRCKEKETSKVETEKMQAEVATKKAKSIIAVIEAKELQGKMHRADDVEAMMEDLIYTLRGSLIALPGRLAVDICDSQTPAEAAEVIRKEVHLLMRELSSYQYDPQKYEERVRERRKWDAADRRELDDD